MSKSIPVSPSNKIIESSLPVEINGQMQNAYGNDYYDDEFDDDE